MQSSKKLIKFICATLLAVTLAGCHVMTKQEQQTAELMPRSVALSIFNKYGLGSIENGFSGSKSFLCGGGVVYDVKLNEVWSAIYLATSDNVVFRSRGNPFTSGCLVLSRIDGVKSAEDARMLVRAAVALGANISYLDYSF